MSQNSSWWFRWRAEAIYVFLVPLGLFVVFSEPIVLNRHLDLALTVLAWFFFLAGTSLRFWALLYIGGRKRRALVDKGPYSICRNPLYVGTFFLAIALCLLFKSILFAGGILLASLVYVISVVPTEEEYLHKKLGEVYADYCRRVPRYLLSFSHYSAEESVEVQLKPVQREFWRATLSTFWIPLAPPVFTYLQDCSWWPRIPAIW